MLPAGHHNVEMEEIDEFELQKNNAGDLLLVF